MRAKNADYYHKLFWSLTINPDRPGKKGYERISTETV